MTAIANPAWPSAMRFIREHACEGIGVDDVLEHVAVSRSMLQRLFRKELGRTILDAITAMRMQRVKQLLTETDLPLADIADRAGFAYVEYLSTSFRRQTGQTPSAYRRKFRKRRASVAIVRMISDRPQSVAEHSFRSDELRRPVIERSPCPDRLHAASVLRESQASKSTPAEECRCGPSRHEDRDDIDQ